ncbi:EAL domain-containing protein [Parvibium lacunae]|uniref:EAL domain-containing protein n=1 Tax=Parvibium lacunae TaxID=1888893 RepID=A0A368L4S1_9BURK|nr:EAL domain-containing protein [Parvibium lacunae]RCS58150.1 EAL domain-containing protein [Parvibium lacunae]
MTVAVTQFRDKLARQPYPATAMGKPHELGFDSDHQQVLGQFYGCRLVSTFQPIYALAGHHVVGYEAFIRSHHHELGGLSPWNLFALQAEDADLVRLDRLCRTVHTLNYFLTAEVPPLFLNVHSRLLLAVNENHGQAFRWVLDSLQIDPASIVLELPVIHANDFPLLAKVVTSYRHYGFKIALNIRQLPDALALAHLIHPDIIKLDSLHVATLADLPEVVATLQQLQIQVIATKVEQPAYLALIRQAGIGLAQGHHLGAPLPAPTLGAPVDVAVN